MSYQEKALRTESRDFTKVRERLTQVKTGVITKALDDLNDVCVRIDALKKHLFYGKELPTRIAVDGAVPEVAPGVETVEEPVSEQEIRLLHVGLGLATEANEFLQELRLHDVNSAALRKELGDTYWYAAIGCDALGATPSHVEEENIAKLTRRYPDKFTEEAAQTHDSH